jgi:hypothetical protein
METSIVLGGWKSGFCQGVSDGVFYKYTHVWCTPLREEKVSREWWWANSPHLYFMYYLCCAQPVFEYVLFVVTYIGSKIAFKDVILAT